MIFRWISNSVCSLLSARCPGHLLAHHACPKVTVSRLIVCDNGGRCDRENCGITPVTQSSAKVIISGLIPVTPGVIAIAKMPVTQSSRFGFLNLNYSALLQ